jgi:hypothetical protein
MATEQPCMFDCPTPPAKRSEPRKPKHIASYNGLTITLDGKLMQDGRDVSKGTTGSIMAFFTTHTSMPGFGGCTVERFEQRGSNTVFRRITQKDKSVFWDIAS